MQTSHMYPRRQLIPLPLIFASATIIALVCAGHASADSVILDDHGTAACYLYNDCDRYDWAVMHVTVVTGDVWNHDDSSSLYDDLRVRDAAGNILVTGMHVALGAPAGTVVTEFDYTQLYLFCSLPPGNVSSWGFPKQCFLGGSGAIRGSAIGSGLVTTFTNSGNGGYTGCGFGVEKPVQAQTWIIYDGPAAVPPPEAYVKRCDLKSGGDGCKNCGSRGMASYSAHSMLASLNIEDTPFGYSPPRGQAIHFTVTYNQREAQQPQTFTYSNLGQNWTFNWLSFVTDDPNNPAGNAAIYVAGGGGENYSGFDSGSQSYLPEPQSHAVLVRTGSSSYEKRFPDGSKQIFTLSDGSTSYPRKIFMTQVVDPAGNPVTIGYDPSFRVTTLTDALGQVTSVSYELASDPLKITRVTEPFLTGRFAAFSYTNGQLTTITDEIGIQSQFHYESGTDFIDSLTTPYGTTRFATGQSGTNKWIEMTDPIGGKERVEYRDNAPGINASETVAPAGMTNSNLDVANTFYWDKKAMAEAPGDYTKARITHWAFNSTGTLSGITASEKAPLENRVWYAYLGQPDTNHTGPSANPSQTARILGDGSTQLFQYEYNSIGKTTRSTDPVGRVTSYVYDTNNIDLLTVYQRNPAGQSVDPSGAAADIIASYSSYNSLHEPQTVTDAARQTTTFSYNTSGQILTRENAKHEITTYGYGDGSTGHPIGYLTSITSPLFNGNSAVTSFSYDSANRVRTVTDSDQYAVTTDYDNLDRPTQITYPDLTTQQFEYTQDFGEGLVNILDLTRSKDRRGLWTTRHYTVNRQMDSITDPKNRTTQYGWCNCGALESITDAKLQTTTFHRDLQGRVYQKEFFDSTTINYLYDGQTAPNTVGASSRLKSMTDAKSQRTNYTYFADDTIQQITYTDTNGQPLTPPTPSVSFTRDPNYNRVSIMVDGSGQTTYTYKPVTVSQPTLGANQVSSIDGPLTGDLITFNYDELGRVINRKINGNTNSQQWTFDSLGRLSSNTNKLGPFNYYYIGVTNRLDYLTYPNGHIADYSYLDNLEDNRLQQIKNQASGNVLLSQFDYTYDDEGQIKTWTKNYPGLSPALQRYDLTYNNADELRFAPLKNASTGTLITQYSYGYDNAANRISEQVGTATTTSIPNSVNEITSQNGPMSRNLYYDFNGSLTDDGLSRTFEWDAANRLVAINYTGTSNRSEFTYDGLSRCVKIVEKTNGSVTSTRKFVWCGMDKCEFRDAGDVVTDFIYPQGQFSGQIKYFYTRDHLGSIREMFRTNGTVVARFDYDPWGRTAAVINTTLPDFNFTGLYRHSTSNLDMAVHRFYDPDLGRWLSRDPIEERGGVNLYAYVANNPNRLIDPLGLYAMMRCYRCKDNSGGPMACFIEEDGHPGPVFDTNRGPNSASENSADPYGPNGPLPPGNYDILPKPNGPASDEPVPGGINFHNGTPSITTPGLAPGQVRTSSGIRGGIRIHMPGKSRGCITCQNYDDIEAMMNRNLNSGGMHLQIIEVTCCNK